MKCKEIQISDDTKAPLNRDEQIEFMKNARERRATAVERWSKSEHPRRTEGDSDE